jgi:hypothetical protein
MKGNKSESQGFDLLQLLRMIGEAYQCMSEYKCAEAIELFKKLPKK